MAGAALTACSFTSDYAGTAYQCGAGGTCPSGYRCVASVCVLGAEGPDGGPAGTGTWTLDTAADFGAAGSTLDGAFIAARGAIEPAAYYTGGVLERGYASAINDATTATWAQVVGQTPTAARSIARSTDVSWGSAPPPGVAMPIADLWTLTFEGEVWLDAGDWTFYYKSDDHGFLDVADATGAFTRVASSNLTDASGVVHVATAGWYPLRWTSSDSSGNAWMRVRFSGPGFASATAIPRHLLRVRADQLTGLVQNEFDGAFFDGDRAMTIDTAAPADVDWGAGAPVDLGLSGTDNFSARWSGQVWIDVAGSYTFHYASDDGQRLWIDGTALLDYWSGNYVHEFTSGPISLDVGWHDVVVDHTETGGTAKAVLTVASGPDLVGQPLPVERMRPVEGRAERYEHGANHGSIAIPDAPSASVDGIADATVSFQGPPGGVVHGVEVGLRYDHGWQGDLRITLIAPSGKTVTLRDPSNNGGGSFYEHLDTVGLDNDPAAGTWTVRFTDTNPGAVGTIRDVELNIHTHNGGAPPIETSATYVSQAHDLGADNASVGQVRWQARQPTGTSVGVQVRTCATADACAGQPWSASLADPTGTTPTVPPGRFVQLRAVLGSSGDAAGSLESIALEYHTP